MHSFDVEMNNFVLFDLKMLNSLFTPVQKMLEIQYFSWLYAMKAIDSIRAIEHPTFFDVLMFVASWVESL